MSAYDELAQEYQDRGVVRVGRLFSLEEVAEIRSEIDRYIRKDLDAKPADARTIEADGKTIRNLWRLERYNEFFRSLAERTEIVDLVENLLGAESVLEGVEVFCKPARVGSAVPLHQDNAYFCQTPPDMLTLWVAIDPVTVDNGAVCFIPGSHKLGMLPTRQSGVAGNSIGLAQAGPESESEHFCATLEPGDATVHHCQIVHYSGENTTENSRQGLLMVFRAAHTKTDRALKAVYDQAVAATPPA